MAWDKAACRTQLCNSCFTLQCMEDKRTQAQNQTDMLMFSYTAFHQPRSSGLLRRQWFTDRYTEVVCDSAAIRETVTCHTEPWDNWKWLLNDCFVLFYSLPYPDDIHMQRITYCTDVRIVQFHHCRVYQFLLYYRAFSCTYFSVKSRGYMLSLSAVNHGSKSKTA